MNETFLLLVPQIAQVAKDWAGIILPPFVDLVNKHVADSKLRFLISVAASLALASALNLQYVLDADWTNVILRTAFIFAQAQIVYKLYWEKSQPRRAMLNES